MSVPISQESQIKRYFYLLVQEFIKNPKHKDIAIIFQDFDNKLKLGHTKQNSFKHWNEVNGVKVLDSEYYTYKYEIQFLARDYKNEDELRGTVVHEFTHLYLYSTIGKHDHDDRFYSQMELLENWLDKNQGLSPRVDKSHDRDQYVGDNNQGINTNLNKNICPRCSLPHLDYSWTCLNNRVNSYPICWSCQKWFDFGEKYWKVASPSDSNKPPAYYCQDCGKIKGLIRGKKILVYNDQTKKELNITTNPKKMTEFNHLKNLLKDSQDLATLENNYQIVKDNSLYSDKILCESNEGYCSNNQKKFDDLYQAQKFNLQFQKNNQSPSTNSQQPALKKKNENGFGTEDIFWSCLAVGGIIFIGLIGYLAGRKSNFKQTTKKKS